MRGLGPNQQKIILLLLAGLTLGMNTSPRGVRKIVQATIKDWRQINRRSLEQAMGALEREKYISFKKKGDFFFPTLTAKGRRQSFFVKLQKMRISRPSTWDGQWRVVLFDIPEKEREIRDYLRQHLKRMGFLRLQESVFVHAYDCEKQIRKISNYYGNGTYIRFLLANRIDNEDGLRKHFGLC